MLDRNMTLLLVFFGDKCGLRSAKLKRGRLWYLILCINFSSNIIPNVTAIFEMTLTFNSVDFE